MKIFVNFTFQSGSIQIIIVYVSRSCLCNFTFQSGSIQMETRLTIVLSIVTLHSNLVLFKWVRRLQIRFICATFTFQSGSIQIGADNSQRAYIEHFTFQSGSIQM